MEDFEKLYFKFQRYVAITGLSLITTTVLYFGSLVGLQYYAERNSPKIKYMSELEEILETEKARLGLKNKIYLFISESEFGVDHWSKNPEGTIYTITLTRRHMNVAGLKHELEHVADGQQDTKPTNRFIHYFWREPRAIFYAAFGK